ncbi:MAG: ribosome assembly cofactor RimP [Flavobacteriales bacterium]
MIEEEEVKQLVESVVQERSLFLVDVQVHPDDRVFVEVDRMDGISVEDCGALNQKVRQALEEKGENFEVNVASPGLDEPFKVSHQFKKNLGQEVSVLTRNGQQIKGVLDEVDGEGIRVRTRKKERVQGKKKKELVEREHRFAFDELKETKAVIGVK